MDKALVRLLNDAMQRSFVGGTIYLSPGIRALPEWEQLGILRAVTTQMDWKLDKQGIHELGAVTRCGNEVWWRVKDNCLNIFLGKEFP